MADDEEQQPPASPVDGLIGGVHQQAEDKIGGLIDQVAGKVPGGDAFSQQAKDTASGLLGQVEGQAAQQVAERLGNLGSLGGALGSLGGLFGHHDQAAPESTSGADDKGNEGGQSGS